MSQKRRNLIAAGLNVAAQEGLCQNRHMDFIKRYGYAYCPFCGIRLEIKLHCEHCERDFTSEESFYVHQNELAMYRANPCPKETRSRHRITYSRRRNRMYCHVCNQEYAVKPQIDTKMKKVV
jgi:hypothetical protein